MLTWVIYDISQDRPRTHAAKVCLRAGLYRVQKSVFLGELNPNEVDELELSLETLIDPETDSVYVIPQCRTDFDHNRLLGQAYDEKLVADELRQLLM